MRKLIGVIATILTLTNASSSVEDSHCDMNSPKYDLQIEKIYDVVSV